MSEIYRITDIDALAESVRNEIFQRRDLGTPLADVGFDAYVTVSQVRSMIKEIATQHDGGTYLNDDLLALLEEMVAKRVVTSSLSRLASEDLIEVAFEDGDFMFFKKESADASE